MNKTDNTAQMYTVGFYECDGSFSVLSSKRFHNMFSTWEEADDACKKLQTKYKHRLEPCAV